MQTFQEGQTYSTRSARDHDCVISLEVVSRTAKTIKAECGHRGLKTLRVAEYNGVECVKPWGSYSMAPVVSAEDADPLPVGEATELDFDAAVASGLLQ